MSHEATVPPSAAPDTEHAPERLLNAVYEELRKLAAAKLAREPAGLTLQPTALVHEAWLRLGGDAQPAWQNRAQFFAAAAIAMQRILVDNARRRHAIRHGGGLVKVSSDATGFDLAAPELDDEGLILLDEALARLRALEPRKAEVISLCYFGGLTLKQAGDHLGLCERTAKRDAAFARAWLFNEIQALRRAQA